MTVASGGGTRSGMTMTAATGVCDDLVRRRRRETKTAELNRNRTPEQYRD